MSERFWPGPAGTPDPNGEPEGALTGPRRLTAGYVEGYAALIIGDTVVVTHAATGRAWRHQVPNYGTSVGDLATRPGFAIGWAQMPDDVEILYFYDRDDDGFGYALNLDCDWCSEWGYSPFAREAA